MKILFKNPDILKSNGEVLKNAFLSVNGNKIDYIGYEYPDGEFDRIINADNCILTSGFYNCHAHSGMSVLRGIGEDLPLSSWLNDRIFPAEDNLTGEIVYDASMFSILEMLKNGIVSFSDMYFFSEDTVRAVAESGIKANIARGIVAFDESESKEQNKRFAEAVSLFKNYNKTCDGRILIDMSMQGEYLLTERCARYTSEFAKENSLGIQIHLCETKKEFEEGSVRRGCTPTEFLEKCGVFDANTTAAHCIYLSENDVDILKNHNVNIAHNPVSNLKLASGIMPLVKYMKKGINISLGTDGAASNNSQDILREANFAVLLQKYLLQDAEKPKSGDILPLLSENGAKAQGRALCGKIEPGCAADLVLLGKSSLNVLPAYNVCDTIIYNINSSNVEMTVVDGKILFEKGVFPFTDAEKVIYNLKKHSVIFGGQTE